MKKVLTLATALALAACGSDAPQEDVPDDVSEVAPVTLPDGSEATPEQAAYLAQVKPFLTGDNAADTLAVLSSGQAGVCDLWTDPVKSRSLAIQTLMEASGYNRTEATAIHTAAVEQLCPGK